MDGRVRTVTRHLHPIGRGDEQGMAMIMAMLIMLICTVVVTASLALAVHSNGQSADQRNLTAALHAADYGLQEELASLAGQPSSGGASCTPIDSGTATLLPNTSLPAQWFSVSLPSCSTSSLTRTIISTGYALGDGSSPATTPPSTSQARTVVSHVTLQPAGALSNGGYGFPDAVLSFGALTATSSAALTVNPLAGYATSIRADGAISLAGGQIGTSLSSWSSIALSNVNPVTGNISSSGAVGLSNTTVVNGNVVGASVSQDGTSTVSGTVRSGVTTLPVQPPAPTFGYLQSDWTTLTGAGAASLSCPASSTLTGLYYFTSLSCGMTPTAIATGAVAVIDNSGNMNITIPAFPGPGPTQLYLIAPNGNISITSNGAAGVQVFAYASGTLSVSGTIVGQLVGGSVSTTAATTLDAQLVSTTTAAGAVDFPPDFAFPTPAPNPAPTGFVPQISDEYLCPEGVTTAC